MTLFGRTVSFTEFEWYEQKKKLALYEIVAEKYKQNLRTVIQFCNIHYSMLIKVYPMKQNVIKCNSLNKVIDHLVMDDDNKVGYLIMERLNSSFMGWSNERIKPVLPNWISWPCEVKSNEDGDGFSYLKHIKDTMRHTDKLTCSLTSKLYMYEC